MFAMKRLSALSGLLLAAATLVFPQGGPEEIKLTVGKSIVIDYPTDIARISTSNPDIADASPVTAREVLIHGKGLGTVTLVVWSKTGQRNFYNITVEQNLESLRKLIKDTFPKEDIQVQSSRDSLSLTGHVSSKAVSEQVQALAAPFAKTTVNYLQIAALPGAADSSARQVRRTGPLEDRSVWRQSDFDGRHQHHRLDQHGTVHGSHAELGRRRATDDIQHYKRSKHFRLSPGSQPGSTDPGVANQ